MSKWSVLAVAFVSLFCAELAEARSLALVPGRGPAAVGERRIPVFVQRTIPQPFMFEDRRDISHEQWAKLDGRPYVVGWHVRDTEFGMFGEPSSRDVSALTGLQIPASYRARTQLGYPGDFSTQIASFADQFSLLVVPGSWNPATIKRDHTPIYVTSAWLEKKVYPFADPRARLEIKLELQVPSLKLAEGEVIFSEFNILFTDETTGYRVGIITVVFDPRGIPQEESVLFEFCNVCTQSLWGGNGLNSTSPWITLLPGTEQGQSSTWTGWRKFGFSISATQFADMLETVLESAREEVEQDGEFAEDAIPFQDICLNPGCYTFSLLTFGPESYKEGVTGGTVLWDPASHFGMSVRNMSVEIVIPR